MEIFVSSRSQTFEEVRTKLTKIHSVTLDICKIRDDLVAKTIESTFKCERSSGS